VTAHNLEAARERLTVNRLGLSWAREADKDLAVIVALLAEVDRLRAEVERVSPPEISPWLDQPREGAGWRSFEKLPRKSLLNLCYALEAMRDNAVLEARNARAEVERLTAQRDAVLALHRPVEVALRWGVSTVCVRCATRYPCLTARALNATPKES
jgi:hypothetical protein